MDRNSTGRGLRVYAEETHQIDPSPEAADPAVEEPDEPGDADDFDASPAALPVALPVFDDRDWDVFIPDDDELDLLPDPGDFWTPDD